MSPRYLGAHARRLDPPPREALLAALLEQTPDPLAALDPQLRLLICNAAYADLARRLLGVELEPGCDLHEALRGHPQLLAWLEEQARRVGEAGPQLAHRRLDDGRTYEIRFAPLPGFGLCQYLRDVTERAAAQRELVRLNTELESRVRERTLNLEWTGQRLREKEERLSAALDAAQTGTFRWEIDTDRLDCDDNLRRLLGLASEPRPNRLADLLERVHPDERAVIAAAVERSRADGAEFDEVFRLDGDPAAGRWLHAKARCYYGECGRAAYITGACVDITELMQAEHELEQREASFRLLADSLPAIVWIRDPTVGLVFANRRWSEYTGLTMEATRNRGWESTVHPDDLPWVRKRVRAVYRAGMPFEAEYRVLRHDGSYRWHLCRALPVRDACGRIRHWYGTAIDVDDQVQIRAHLEAARAEAERNSRELKTSLMQLEAVIESLGDGLVIFDAEGNRIALNRAARRLFRVSDDEPERQSLQTLVSRCALSRLDGTPIAEAELPVRRVLAGERFSVCELEVRPRGGEPWTANYSGAPVQDEQGQVMFAIISVRDITEQKRAEQQLRDALESRDRFLSIASHELRTPLTSLSLHLQMARRRLLREPPAIEEQMRALDLGNRQVRRLTRLVDDLLDVSRIEAGRLEFHYQPVELGQLARDAAEQLAGPLREAGCALTLRIAQEVSGHWDADRLEQVVGNLLTNCIKYAPGCAVELAVEREDDHAVLRVRDSGEGIPLADQEKIFRRFERSSSSSVSSGPGGLGLGLYLVRQIVEAHGGRVELLSAPGAGCTFVVRLPLRPAAGASSSHAV